MSSIQERANRSAALRMGLVAGLMLASPAALAEPPIRSPQDAACRIEAKARVFSAPNPRGLELEEIGRQIYFACLSRLSQALQPAKTSGRRARRHKRR
jgi:hypothetical protein